MRARISVKDQAVVDALRQRVDAAQQPLGATEVVGNSMAKRPMDAVLRERWQRWQIDGSVVIGRVDTSNGQRVYVATIPRAISLYELGTALLPETRAEALGLWGPASSESREDVVLVRHLTVDGWRVTDSRDDYDHRRQVSRTWPGPDTNPATDQLATLLTMQSAAKAALETAALQLDDGARISDEAVQAVQDWNEALAEAGELVGLAGDKVTLHGVREALQGKADAVRARRGEVVGRAEALERLDSAIALGGPAAPHLAALRQNLALSLQNAVSLALAGTFMDQAGGSSAQGAVWSPAGELARRYLVWRHLNVDLQANKDELLDGLSDDTIMIAALWSGLVAIDRDLAGTRQAAPPDPVIETAVLRA